MNTETEKQEMNVSSALLAAFEAGRESSVEGVADTSEQIIVPINHKLIDNSEAVLKRRKASEGQPEVTAGTMELHQVEAVIAAVKLWGGAHTHVMADAAEFCMVVHFDGLNTQKDSEDSRVHPGSGWNQLRGLMKLRESDKLKHWKQAGDWMKQKDFAEFLEDHALDVVTPEGSDLLEIVSDLEATSSGSFKGKVSLQNGDVSLAYQNETETNVEIPKEIKLGIPLFEHGQRYSLTGRLRFRVHGGEVYFKIMLVNLDDAKRQEFSEMVGQIKEKIDEPVIEGRFSTPWDR